MAEGYDDFWYRSEDGLRLYARDYRNPAVSLSVLCMPGLTRNSADFAEVCKHLQGRYRAVAADQRGRGRSQWAEDKSSYQPRTYLGDMTRLIGELGLERTVLLGTSLGGMMAMMMNALAPGRFAAVILNDIGPVVHPAGLERIRGYVGKSAPVTNWQQATEQVRALNLAAFPSYTEADWERFARRTYGENERGEPVPLYDPAIAEPIDRDESSAVPSDLWPVFDALTGVPTLLVRGELSDILHSDTAAEMQRRKSDLQVMELPGVGHAPMLDEPGVLPVIDAFLQKVAAT